MRTHTHTVASTIIFDASLFSWNDASRTHVFARRYCEQRKLRRTAVHSPMREGAKSGSGQANVIF
jgi:hypothetical protein